MRRICAQCVALIALTSVPVLGMWHLMSYLRSEKAKQLTDRFITLDEITIGVVLTLLLAWTILVCDAAIGLLKKTKTENLAFIRKPMTWIAGTLAITPQVQPGISTAVPTQSVPVTTLLSPAIAAAVLRHVLARRRHQVHEQLSPDRLTSDEARALAHIVHRSDGATALKDCNVDLLTDADVVQVLRAVERPASTGSVQPAPVITEWSAVVQIFGYPQVMSASGDIAIFRKKRSLELLTWLSLNRDRSRRTAARTALWDFDVNDSTFSTIVSDLRRGLGELLPTMSRDEWVPITFTDHIPLSAQVVTDAELLHQALEKFRANKENIDELLTYLGWIRDVPFAGTSYSWADLDGSTTRLVIIAMNASREVAEWATANNHALARDIAVTAGLRVMPGDEELLAMLAVS